MSNKLISDSEFQVAVPTEEGLLTLRSTNTESPSNSNLLDTYNLAVTEIPDTVIPERPTAEELIVLATPLEISTALLIETVQRTLLPNDPLITECLPIEDIPVLFYAQGTCFDNLSSDALITDKEDLFLHLCDVLIRFDESPKHYQKEDYAALIRMLTGSLIYLYNKDETDPKTTTSPAPFVGIATLETDPIAYARDNNYAFPGVYLAQQVGSYVEFGIVVDQEDLESSVVVLLPIINDNIFSGYKKEIYILEITNPSTFTYVQEEMIGLVNGSNRVFITSVPMKEGSLLVFLNGIKEKNYTIDSDRQITLENAPLNAGFEDSIEAHYTAQ